MAPIIFDGRAFAKRKENELRKSVQRLRTKGIIPKMVSIVVGDVDGAMKYQEMKKQAGERIGIKVEITVFPAETEVRKVLKELILLRSDSKVHGIMIQIPLPRNFSQEDKELLINTIDPKKDVDGMREDSMYDAPVVRAVVNALDEARRQSPDHTRNDNLKLVVIGAKGFEGKKIVHELKGLGYKVEGLDKDDFAVNPERFRLDADVVISCTGVSGLITGDMIKEGTIVIDVGAPKGDCNFESVAAKASFITPVPGGIGPVTIALLMENVFEAVEKQ